MARRMMSDYDCARRIVLIEFTLQPGPRSCVEFRGVARVQNLRGHAEFLGLLCGTSFLLERMLRFAERKQSPLHQAKIIARFSRQFLKAGTARQM